MIAAEAAAWRGAVLGASAAPAALWGAHWSALGASGWVALLVGLVAGGLLGASTYPVFTKGAPEGFGFSALFGAVAGLLGGAFVGGPVGGVFATAAGGVAGLGAHGVFVTGVGGQRKEIGALVALAVGGSLASGVAWSLTL